MTPGKIPTVDNSKNYYSVMEKYQNIDTYDMKSLLLFQFFIVHPYWTPTT